MSPKRRLFAACAGRFFRLARAIISAARRAISIVFFDTAKVIFFHCGSRMFRQKFFHFFCDCVAVLTSSTTAGARHSPSKLWLCTRCCSVAVLQFSRSYSHTPKILLYLYIYLYIYKYRVEISLSYSLFLNCNTATLQHCNTWNQREKVCGSKFGLTSRTCPLRRLL